MAEACSNSWEPLGCDWTIGYLWRSSDLFERLIFVALALLLAYTFLVLVRFSLRYASARSKPRGLPPGPNNTERCKRKLVANLRQGLGTLRGISSIAPYLGLAGTCDGVVYRLMGLGIAMSWDRFVVVASEEVAAALITTAAGIVVATSAILSYTLLTTLTENLQYELTSISITSEPIGRRGGFAQTLPLRGRFSGLPPYALVAAPLLASVVATFAFFQPYVVPTGLSVRLLPIGSLEKHRTSATPGVVSVVSESGSGTAVARVNSEAIPLDDLDRALLRKQKGASKREVYVEAEGTLQWGDVVRVIDIAEGVGDGHVVLLTTTPNAASANSSRR